MNDAFLGGFLEMWQRLGHLVRLHACAAAAVGVLRQMMGLGRTLSSRPSAVRSRGSYSRTPNLMARHRYAEVSHWTIPRLTRYAVPCSQRVGRASRVSSFKPERESAPSTYPRCFAGRRERPRIDDVRLGDS